MFGQDSAFTTAVAPMANQVVEAILPQMKDIVKRASEAAEPTIRTVVREEVMPTLGLIAVLGLAGGAAIAAAVGAHYATRRRR